MLDRETNTACISPELVSLYLGGEDVRPKVICIAPQTRLDCPYLNLANSR